MIFFIFIIVMIILSGGLFAVVANSASSSETKESNTNKNFAFITDFSDRFKQEISTIKNVYGFDVPNSLILAVIRQESGSKVFTKQNKDVIGDLNLSSKAFGYMQVREPALIDVNMAFGTNFKESDLLNEQNNLIVGIAYLQLCYNRARLANTDNVVKLTLQKYNAGVGTKETSFRGKSYANSAFNFYQEFQGVVV